MSYPDNQGGYNNDLGRFVDNMFRDERGMIDRRKYFYAGQSIRSDKFAQMAAIVDDLLVFRDDAYNQLPASWAEVMVQKIDGMIYGTELVIASKNSETVANGQANSSLQHRISKTTTEHVVSSPEEATRSIVDYLRGGKTREYKDDR